MDWIIKPTFATKVAVWPMTINNEKIEVPENLPLSLGRGLAHTLVFDKAPVLQFALRFWFTLPLVGQEPPSQ